MKKITALLLLITLFYSSFNIVPSSALAANEVSTIILEDEYYYETIISEERTDTFALQPVIPTITKTKTTRMKNSSGQTLWTLSITATFTYDGKIAECVNCTPNATSYDSSWTIQSITSSRENNSATATMVIRYTEPSGSLYQDYTKSVTITCDPSGNVS